MSSIDIVRLTEESSRAYGKFQGEGPETVYFWEHSGNGELLESNPDWGSGCELFAVDREEREAFGFEADVRFFLLSWDSQGFVTGDGLTDAQEADVRAQVETDRQAEEDERERELAASDRQPVYQVLHSSVTGCHPLTRENAERFETRAAALVFLNVRAEDLRARGFDVVATRQRPGEFPCEYDISEPEDCSMVPEDVGNMRVVDDELACGEENERRREAF